MASFKKTSFPPSGTIGLTPTQAETILSKTQESMRNNKQPIRKQHADNQSEEDTSHRGGKGEKEEGTERGKNAAKLTYLQT